MQVRYRAAPRPDRGRPDADGERPNGSGRDGGRQAERLGLQDAALGGPFAELRGEALELALDLVEQHLARPLLERHLELAARRAALGEQASLGAFDRVAPAV